MQGRKIGLTEHAIRCKAIEKKLSLSLLIRLVGRGKVFEVAFQEPIKLKKQAAIGAILKLRDRFQVYELDAGRSSVRLTA